MTILVNLLKFLADSVDRVSRDKATPIIRTF